MRIGDFARLGNVSVRALRFYDQTKLLRPLHTDPASGYRQYGPAQIARLLQIRAFQDLGFSLAEIRQLLQRDLSPASLCALMEQRRSDLKKHIHDDFARLARIDQRLQELNARTSAASPILVHTTQDAWVVSLREKLAAYDQAEELFQEIERAVPRRCLTGKRAALWHACQGTRGRIDCEAIRYLKGPMPVSRGLRSYRLPAATIASVFHTGSDATVTATYQQMNGWLANSDFRLHGAKREIYWTREGDQSLTEIQYPLKRAVAKRSRAA